MSGENKWPKQVHQGLSGSQVATTPTQRLGHEQESKRSEGQPTTRGLLTGAPLSQASSSQTFLRELLGKKSQGIAWGKPASSHSSSDALRMSPLK